MGLKSWKTFERPGDEPKMGQREGERLILRFVESGLKINCFGTYNTASCKFTKADLALMTEFDSTDPMLTFLKETKALG